MSDNVWQEVTLDDGKSHLVVVQHDGQEAIAYTDGNRVEWAYDLCHCGRPVSYGFDGNPHNHRGMCDECDARRCDAYPLECPYRGEFPEEWKP